MTDNTCPICGEKLNNGICPDCGGGSDDSPLRTDGGKKLGDFYTEKVFGKEPRSLRELIFSKEHLWKFILALILPLLVFIPVHYAVRRYRRTEGVTLEAKEKRKVNTALWALSLALIFIWVIIGANVYINALSAII